jgi:hypothetical protein
MCYNRRAVERAAKQGLSSAGPKQSTAASSEATPQLDRSSAAKKAALSAVTEEVDRLAIAPTEERSAVVREEHALLYCPVCSQRLESRRCKLICLVCGYYMSCADYY